MGTQAGRRTSFWKALLVGSLSGLLAGFMTGLPMLFAWLWIDHRRNGTVHQGYGYEFIGAPILGAILGFLEGACLGIVWTMLSRRPRRLTISELMIAVAIAGPWVSLLLEYGFLVIWTALVTISIALLTLPELFYLSRHKQRRRVEQRAFPVVQTTGLDSLRSRLTTFER
jgi:hypothetical protein